MLITKTSASQELPFSCNPPIISLPSSCIESTTASDLFSGDPTSPDRILRSLHPGAPPLSGLGLQIETILPEPPVLIRGQSIRIRLLLHTPQELLRYKIYVRSVEIELRTSVTAYPGIIPRQVTETRPLSGLRGMVCIDKEHLEVDLGSMGNFFIFDSQPTCMSHIFQLIYSVTTIVGLSRGFEKALQVCY